MLNESLGANYGDMGNTASTFNAKVSELEGTLSQIQNMIEQLGASWIGQGYTSFSTVMSDWNRSVTQLNQTLSEISTNVNRGVGTYTDADHGVAVSFSGFQIK